MTEQKIIISLSKLVDEYFGRPLIYLSLLMRFLRGKKQNGHAKLLFIKFWGIGSIVLSEPALKWLKKEYPNCEIHYLTLSRNLEIFKFIPHVSKVHTISLENLVTFALHTIKALWRIRSERFQIIFDGEFFANYSALIAFWARSTVVGFSQAGNAKNLLLDSSIPFDGNLHTYHQFLNLVRTSQKNEVGDESAPRLTLPARKPALASQSYIILNVNASDLALERRWARDRFIRLAKDLLRHFEYDIVLIGTSAEADYVAPVETSLNDPKRVINLAGKTNLQHLIYLINGSSLLISNDSGPLHIAASLDIPVVGFFGPETPVRYGPASKRKLVFYLNLPCSPCMSVENAKTVRCTNQLACMNQLKTNDVIRRVRNFIHEFLESQPQNYRVQSQISL